MLVFIVMVTLLVSSCGLREPREVNDSHFSAGWQATNGPRLTVIGDSQSTGVIASTTMGQQPPDGLFSNLLPFFYSNNPSMENLQEHFSEYRNSAVATDQSWGLRAILGKPYNRTADEVPLYLAAQWGGKIRHLPELIAKLSAAYQREGTSPSDVVLMLGANDLCTGEASGAFVSSFAHGLRLVADAHPQARLLVAMVPPVPQLIRYNHHYNDFLTCEQVRLRFCPAIFAADFEQQYIAYNAGIERTVKALQEERGQVILVEGFRGMFFQENLLAFDCFHPNSAAQLHYAQFFNEALGSRQSLGE